MLVNDDSGRLYLPIIRGGSGCILRLGRLKLGVDLAISDYIVVLLKGLPSAVASNVRGLATVRATGYVKGLVSVGGLTVRRVGDSFIGFNGLDSNGPPVANGLRV